MTTYALVGGFEREHDEFAQEISTLILARAAKPKLVSCMFAKKPMKLQQDTEAWMQWFGDTFGDKIEVQLASKEDFLEQVRWADVIYLHGGDNDSIKNAMKQYEGIPGIFDGKLVIASSAGANFLSDNYYTRKFREWQKGIGVLKLDIMVHFGAKTDIDGNVVDWEYALDTYDTSSPNPLIKIPEGKIIVFER